MEYPFHVHDIQISDPFVLADPVTGKPDPATTMPAILRSDENS